jgi:hypothetical protein
MISLVLVLSGITVSPSAAPRGLRAEGFGLLAARASRLFFLFFLGGGTIFHATFICKEKRENRRFRPKKNKSDQKTLTAAS